MINNPNLTITYNEQGTFVWLMERLGLFTGSPIENICKPKGLGETGLTYIDDKCAEILTGEPEGLFTSKHTDYGKLHEPYARELYEKATGYKLFQCGFVKSKLYPDCGVSLDGAILELKKLVELKCPSKNREHLSNLKMKTAEDLKKKKPIYYWQIQLCLLITEYEIADYVSYSPAFKPELMLFALEVPANKTDQEFLKLRISEASKIKHEILTQLK